MTYLSVSGLVGFILRRRSLCAEFVATTGCPHACAATFEWKFRDGFLQGMCFVRIRLLCGCAFFLRVIADAGVVLVLLVLRSHPAG